MEGAARLYSAYCDLTEDGVPLYIPRPGKHVLGVVVVMVMVVMVVVLVGVVVVLLVVGVEPREGCKAWKDARLGSASVSMAADAVRWSNVT